MIKIGNTQISPDTAAQVVSEGEGSAPLDSAESEAIPTEMTEPPAVEAHTPTDEGASLDNTPTLDDEIPTGEDRQEQPLPRNAQNPEPVSELREVAERLMQERTQMTIEREMAQVSERFPELRELGDVFRLRRYPEIKSMVGRGYSLSDAVRLAYEDVYLARRANAAVLQARTEAFSTSHLHPTRPAGEGRCDVTESQIREYIDAIPGSSREQAIAAYRRFKVGRG